MKQLYFSSVILAFLFIVVHQTDAQISCAWKPIKQDFSLPKDNSLFTQSEKNPTEQITDNDAVYTLPVVVHIINTGDSIGSADNPSDSLINAMIVELNKCWRKTESVDGGVDMKMQFALAVRSPQCGSTTGITRVDGSSIPNYASGGITNNNTSGSADETLVKNLSRWPNTDYINIWIVNKINGNAYTPGGYTYFPEYNTAATDGLILNASVVNGTNKTIAHEMGHCFYLYHPFEDEGNETFCAANDNCATEGDMICDLEPELNVPCNTATNTCNNNQPFLIVDTAHNYTVLNNYMGYTTCQYMFTEEQKIRARNALFSYRYSLITSGALTPPNGLTPIPSCTPVAVYGLSPYYGVEKVEFNTLSVYSNTSEADGSIYVDRTCNQSTTVKQGKKYVLTVTGSYGNPHRIKVFIDYNNNGTFDDANETVLSMYTDTASKKITIPKSGVVTGVPLRMRVVADNPAKPAPSACKLHGTSDLGAGQAEDYTVIVTPASKEDLAEDNGDEIAVDNYHVNVYPNPAHDLENIVVYSKVERDISMKFSDASGHIIAIQKRHCNVGVNYFRWNVQSITAGIYYISFDNIDLKPVKVLKQ